MPLPDAPSSVSCPVSLACLSCPVTLKVSTCVQCHVFLLSKFLWSHRFLMPLPAALARSLLRVVTQLLDAPSRRPFQRLLPCPCLSSPVTLKVSTCVQCHGFLLSKFLWSHRFLTPLPDAPSSISCPVSLAHLSCPVSCVCLSKCAISCAPS